MISLPLSQPTSFFSLFCPLFFWGWEEMRESGWVGVWQTDGVNPTQLSCKNPRGYCLRMENLKMRENWDKGKHVLIICHPPKRDFGNYFTRFDKRKLQVQTQHKTTHTRTLRQPGSLVFRKTTTHTVHRNSLKFILSSSAFATGEKHKKL